MHLQMRGWGTCDQLFRRDEISAGMPRAAVSTVAPEHQAKPLIDLTARRIKSVPPGTRMGRPEETLCLGKSVRLAQGLLKFLREKELCSSSRSGWNACQFFVP